MAFATAPNPVLTDAHFGSKMGIEKSLFFKTGINLRNPKVYLCLLNLSLGVSGVAWHIGFYSVNYACHGQPCSNVNYMYRDPKCITFRYTTHQVKYHM